ncbi:Pr6Pr family membrane protein [Pedococcus soli]
MVGVTPTHRRAVHGVVAAVTLAAVLWQLVLIVNGEAVLDETAAKPLGTRLVEFISYFTVLSNLLVAYVSLTLARDPDHDGTFWRVVRLATIEGITVTGLVHWFFLRPILDLHGASYVVDKLLHVVVPILALVAWAVAGPRGQAVRSAVLPSLGWPLLWGLYTLVRGVVADWWPYPFMNVDTLGWGRVLLNLAAIAVLFAVVGLGFVAADRALARRRQSDG